MSTEGELDLDELARIVRLTDAASDGLDDLELILIA